MADEKRNTSSDRRRRPAPTIDLSATEVTSAEPPPSSQTETENSEPKAAGASDHGRRSAVIPLLAGGVAGAALVSAVWWLAGPLSFERQTQSDQLGARIGALETQLKAAAKPAENPMLTELNARLGKLEQTAGKSVPAASDTSSNERLTAIENALKTLGVTLTALNRRAEDTAGALSAVRERAETAARTAESLQAKLDGIERSAKATQDKVAQSSRADIAARRALAAVALRDAVARGVPYAAELAVMKQLGADQQALAALEPFAQAGVPTEGALIRELRALLPALVAATGADASRAAGFVERLQANAGKLVRVHPIGEPTGNDASAVVARIEVKATHNNLAGVADELAKLPPKARTLTEGWSKKLAARDAALAATRKLAAESAAALGSP